MLNSIVAAENIADVELMESKPGVVFERPKA